MAAQDPFAALDRYWSSRFSCPESQWRVPGEHRWPGTRVEAFQTGSSMHRSGEGDATSLGEEFEVLVLPPGVPMEHDPRCRLLAPEDATSVSALLASCPPADLALAKVNLTDPMAFGHFEPELVAMATFWFWGPDVADVGVLVGPQGRGRGAGRAVVTSLIGAGLRIGKAIQYRHVPSNLASARLGAALGFVPYGTWWTAEKNHAPRQ